MPGAIGMMQNVCNATGGNSARRWLLRLMFLESVKYCRRLTPENGWYQTTEQQPFPVAKFLTKLNVCRLVGACGIQRANYVNMVCIEPLMPNIHSACTVPRESLQPTTEHPVNIVHSGMVHLKIAFQMPTSWNLERKTTGTSNGFHRA